MHVIGTKMDFVDDKLRYSNFLWACRHSIYVGIVRQTCMHMCTCLALLISFFISIFWKYFILKSVITHHSTENQSNWLPNILVLCLGQMKLGHRIPNVKINRIPVLLGWRKYFPLLVWMLKEDVSLFFTWVKQECYQITTLIFTPIAPPSSIPSPFPLITIWPLPLHRSPI